LVYQLPAHQIFISVLSPATVVVVVAVVFDVVVAFAVFAVVVFDVVVVAGCGDGDAVAVFLSIVAIVAVVFVAVVADVTCCCYWF
jgi:hypothetical protein